MKPVFLQLTKSHYCFLLLSFFIPFLIFGAALAQFGVYPFGDKSILTSDMFSQYIQFYNRLYDSLYSGKSLFYSWEAGLGLNLVGVIAYYLSSPLSLLILFFERSHLPEAMILLTLCKLGLSGATMFLFLNSFTANQKYKSLIFSTMYALMTFSILYSFNIMWLDGIYMMPLIMLGVERLITKGRYTLFLVSLAITFIANFYTSYMVGVFAFLYFIVRFVVIHKASFSTFLRKFLLFCMSTGIAAGISAFLIFPTYVALKTNSVETIEPAVLQDTHIFAIYLKFFNGTFDSLVNGLPSIYAGLLTLLLFPYFFISKKISLIEKLAFSVVFLLLVISFQNDTLYFFMHGMDNPNWFPYRYSFLLSFLNVYLAFRAFTVLDKRALPYVTGIYLINMVFIFYMSKQNPDMISYKVLWVNLVLLTLYVILLYCKLYAVKAKKWVAFLLVVTVCLDVSLNSAVMIRSLGYYERAAYQVSSDYQSIIAWVKEHDPSFYRIDVREPLTLNDSMLMDYKKMENFNSLVNIQMNSFLNQLGYTVNDNIAIYMNGGMIPTDSLLGFKYTISKYPINKQGYELIHQEGDLLLYENKNALPLGAVLNNKKEITFSSDATNPFERQNELYFDEQSPVLPFYQPVEPTSIEYENLTVTNKAGQQKFVKKDKMKKSFITYSFSVSDRQELYTIFKIDGYALTNVRVNDVQMRNNYPSYSDKYVLDLGGFENEKAIVQLELLYDQLVMAQSPLFYRLDMSLFEERVTDIQNQTFKVNSLKDTFVSGTIELNQDGVLFLSIPYDRGWSATVDGKETTVERLGGFAGVRLTEGQHTVELNYVPPGFLLGSIISLSSLILFVVLQLVHMRIRKRVEKN